MEFVFTKILFNSIMMDISQWEQCLQEQVCVASLQTVGNNKTGLCKAKSKIFI